MKAKLIAINWACSFMGLMVEEPIWVFLIGYFWFLGSTMLMIYADRNGWMKEFDKQYKLNEE